MDSAHYLALLEEVALDAAAYASWPLSRAEEYGISMPAKAHHIEFISPAGLGDDIEIATCLELLTDTRAVRHCLFSLSDREPVARAQTEWVCASLETGQPVPIPDDWLEDFADQIVDD